MDQPLTNCFTLPNGLRAVVRRAECAVEICGLAIDAGSRDETPRTAGLAHFVEHTLFKGTKRRRARHINSRMEAVGGELNAYTTKEETMLYSLFPAGHLDRAVELIADLVKNSQFPVDEIEREREVVCDEIKSYLDTPSEGIFDDFEELAFAGSPLAHNILGSEQSVANLTGADCRNFLDRLYTPANMVFFYSGPLNAEKVEKIAARHFGSLSHPATTSGRISPPPIDRFDLVRPNGLHQSHTVVGVRLPDLTWERRVEIDLLTNILGGPGMNSLLNVTLREKRGLVYSIDASTTMFSDAGLMTIYFGCDHDDRKRCLRLVADVIDSLTDKTMTQRHLDAVRKQYLGQLTVGSVSLENSALAMARSVLRRGVVTTRCEIESRLKAISPASLRETAAAIASHNCSVLTLC